MKLLKLRRNVVKLSLFRHFTNTLIFAVIGLESSHQSSIEELWIEDAFWRLLFSTILLVIMFLWRPSASCHFFTQICSFGLQAGGAARVSGSIFFIGFFSSPEGMKMRGTKNETNGTAKAPKVDEDLKWVEENIPSSMADVALPPLLDSDEVSFLHFLNTTFDVEKSNVFPSVFI
uniref:GOST seven transmembrane domain-containing protein n=1 Tax=Nothobranchius furzeri TaxID=105023 RepID=A0A8C6MG10_NOTFU